MIRVSDNHGEGIYLADEKAENQRGQNGGRKGVEREKEVEKRRRWRRCWRDGGKSSVPRRAAGIFTMTGLRWSVGNGELGRDKEDQPSSASSSFQYLSSSASFSLSQLTIVLLPRYRPDGTSREHGV